MSVCKTFVRARRAWIASVVVCASLVVTAVSAQGQARGGAAREHWVSSWATAQLIMPMNFGRPAGAPAPASTPPAAPAAAPRPAAPPPIVPPPPVPTSFADQTIRMVVRTSLGGPRVRIALSQMLNAEALEVGAAHIALSKGGSAIEPGSGRALTFAGRPSVTVQPGVLVLSDPIDMAVGPLTDVAISLYVPKDTGAPSIHRHAIRTTYVAKGNVASAASLPSDAETFVSYFWLSSLDVVAAPEAFTIATLGDSITDGYATTVDANLAWPSLLAKRLAADSRTRHIGVVNQGISGNQLLRNGAGVSMLARFDRDILSRPGVRWMVLLAGINDINFRSRPGTASLTPEELIAGYEQLIDRCRAHGIRIVGATITPQEGQTTATEASEATRQKVNAWIRTSGRFDAVVDFDAVLRDPARPARLLPEFDPGDRIHPNDRGNEAMAAAFDLAVFAGQSPAPTPPQAAAQAPRRMATPTTALVSPEVHADRRVTLRFRAPAATDVQVVGELMQGKGAQPMTRDAEGLWTITLGPLPPEIWSYNFRVHGVDVVDPSNPAVKPTPPGAAMSSFVQVPGDAPAFYDARKVPHGDVRMVLYESASMGMTRWLWIYTPPGYDQSRDRYPVLYLLHGNGEAQNGWVMNGRANIILDNSIAEGRVAPMIVVMPQGHALQGANVGPLVRVTGETSMFSPLFPRDLLEDVLPLVERQYRVKTGPEYRAIAGLSMGGGQAMAIGLTNPKLFGYVLGFSAAVGERFLDVTPLLPESSAASLRAFRLVWLSSGREDFLFQANKDFAAFLRSRGVDLTYRETDGAHVWSVWRHNLRDTLPLLFK